MLMIKQPPLTQKSFILQTKNERRFKKKCMHSTPFEIWRLFSKFNF